MKSRLILVRGVALLLAAFGAVHCGGDDDDSSGSAGAAAIAGHSGTGGSSGGAGGSSGAGSSSLGGEAGAGSSSLGGEAGAGSSSLGGEAGAGSSSLGGEAGAAPRDDIPTWNGCAESAYADHSDADDARTIAIAQDGLVYTPKCMLIAAGQSVTFEGSLSAHPLAPGNADDAAAGSPDNPIEETSSGRSVSFSFAEPGTYPYHCQLHGFGNGSGMSGAIHVR